MKQPRGAIVFGEVVVDVYPDEEVIAGAALHVAAHLALVGWRTYLVTRVGDDRPGTDMLELIERHGIDPRFVERDRDLPTGRTTIHTSGLENSFTVHGPAAWDAIEGPSELPPHDAVVYGTLAARSSTSRAAMERLLARSRARHKILDVNLRPPDVDEELLEMTLQAATAVKLNEDELRDVASQLGIRPEPATLFARARDLEWACVTCGERGAVLSDRSGSSWHAGAEPVEVDNTVGAGDAFTAGLTEALVEGLPPDRVLQVAQRRAASILTKKGGLPGAPPSNAERAIS